MRHESHAIVPTQTQGTQAWDRYAFVNNNPVRYNDPTGHGVDCGIGEDCMGNQTNPNDLATNGKDIDSGGDGEEEGDGEGTGSGGKSKNSPSKNSEREDSLNLGVKIKPPPPFPACESTDCWLALGSFLLSGIAVAFMGVPQIAIPAVILDAIVTLIAIARTNEDYRLGEISSRRRDHLNGSALLGIIPYIGLAAGLYNTLATVTGLPQ